VPNPARQEKQSGDNPTLWHPTNPLSLVQNVLTESGLQSFAETDTITEKRAAVLAVTGSVGFNGRKLS
jgi:hypothetical protein